MTPPVFSRFLFRLLAGLTFLCCASAFAAEAEDTPQQPAEIAGALDEIEAWLGKGTGSEGETRDRLELLGSLRAAAHDCVATREARLKAQQEALASLGDVLPGEPAEVRSKRRTLERDKAVVDNQLAQCRLQLLRSEELQATANARLKGILAQRLLAKGPNLQQVIMDHWNQVPQWLSQLQGFLLQASGFEKLDDWERILLGLLLAGSVAFGSVLRRRIRAALQQRAHEDSGFAERFSTATLATFGHFLPHLLASALASVYLFHLIDTGAGLPFINVLAYGLTVYYLLLASVLVFLAPRRPARQLFDLDPKLMRALARRLRVLLVLAFIIYLFLSVLLVQRLPEAALFGARGVVVALFALNLVWAVWLLGRFPGLAGTLWLRLGAYLLLVAVVAAEWMGYRNLALSGFRGVVGTMLLVGLLMLFLRLLSEFYDNLDAGYKPRHQRIRDLLGVLPGQPVSGLIWVRFITILALWGLFLMLLLKAWGLSEATIQELRLRAVQGIDIGSLHIDPGRVLLAILVTALLLALSGWFRARLDRRWLTKTHMERGAREAMVTVAGYAGTAVAILVGLGITGLDFGNLALIFGALSVGIGFGLQNIVNNFVSGLILLFERPIKTGDWVVVGGTEGYVKRIRIRSTQIQTFDRADVIVPNSDLISNQVTNWMLEDTGGRVRLPVGVAYGSDTQLVKQILLKIADEHPSVITDGAAPAPKVWFTGFGDSALNFMLLAYIRNIDERMSVLSDLNFALDAAFREAGVEIPFPQRDLHLRSLPPDDRS